MDKNVGGTDKNLRIATGIVLLLGGIVGFSISFYPVFSLTGGLAGAMVLATGIIGFCPFNMVLGIDTCNIEQK